MPPSRPNSKATHLLSSTMLVSAACTYAVSGDAPSTLMITVGALTVSFFLPRPFDRSSRTYIYGSVFVMTAVALEMQMFPVEPARFFLLPAEVYCPLLLYLGVAATYVEDREPNLCAIVAFALLAMMLAGNTLTPDRVNERLPFSDGALQNFHTFFAIALAVQMGAMAALLHRISPRSRRIQQPRGRFGWLRIAVLTTCLVVAGLGTLGMRQTVFAYEMLLNRWFNQLFHLYMRRRTRRVVFDSEVDLWRTVPHQTAQDNTVVIRAESKRPPGYLRGRVYLRYAEGQWGGSASGVNLRGREAGGKRVFTIFDRPLPGPKADPAADASGDMVDIYAHRLYTDVLLAPGTADRFELIAERLRNSGTGVLQPETWKQEAGYRLRMSQSGLPDAYPLPRVPWPPPDSVTQIPDDLTEPLGRIAEDICGPETLEPHVELNKIVAHLNETCTYELGVNWTGDDDPILQFLRTTHRGHCELFASSAVLLLRSRGIAARYVTGFVCMEQNPVGKHWVARLRDAHAWAEAYIPRLNQWVLVEATPATGVPDGERAGSTPGSWLDAIRLFFQSIMAKMKRGDVADAIVRFTQALTRLVSVFVFSPPGIVILILAVLLTGRNMRRHYLRRKRQDALFPDTVRELRRHFARLERFLRSKGIERSDDTTARELALRVAGLADAPWSQAVATVLEDYERLRYSLPAPSPADVAEFAIRVRAACV